MRARDRRKEIRRFHPIGGKLEEHLTRSSRSWWPLVIPLAAALAVRTVLTLSVRYLEYDEAIYMDVARNIIRTGRLLRSLGQSGVPRLEHTPLYLYLLAAVQHYLSDNVILARSVAEFFSLGCIVLVYMMIAQYHSAPSAVVGALVLGVQSFFGVYSYFIRMEVPMCFFVLLGAFLILRWDLTGRFRYLWLSGLSLAIAVMMKEIALISVGGLLCFVWLQLLRTRERRVTWLLPTVALCLPTMLALAGWGIMAWSMSSAEVNAVLVRWKSAVLGGGLADAARQGINIFAWTWTLVDTVVGEGLFALLAIGVVVAFSRRRRLSPVTILFGLVSIILVLASFVVSLKEPRHVIVLVPSVSVLVGSLINWDSVLKWFENGSWRRVGALALLPLILDVSVFHIFPTGQAGLARWVDPVFFQRAVTNDRYYGALAGAGSYLSTHSPPDAVITILHEATVVGYYADRNYNMLYTLPYAKAITVLEDTNYLVYDQPVFLQQSEMESAEVLSIIDREFRVAATIQVEGREVVIYERIPNA